MRSKISSTLTKYFSFCLFILTCLCLSTCQKINGVEDDKYLLLNKGYINLNTEPSKTESQMTFKVSATVSWEIKSSVKWLSVSPSSGTAGVSEVTITFTKNDSTSIRRSILDVYAAEINEHKTITVTQLGTDEDILISVSKDNFDFKVYQYETINVVSNTSWELITDSLWLKVIYQKGKNNDNVLFIPTFNLSNNNRVVNLCARTLSGKKQQCLAISQKPIPPPSNFQISEPKNNLEIVKNNCMLAINNIDIAWTSSLDPLGGNIKYYMYIDTILNAAGNLNKIYDSSNTTKFNLNYLTLKDGAYYMQIAAQTTLGAIIKSGIIKFSLKSTEIYTKVATVAGGNGVGSYLKTGEIRNNSNQFDFCSDFYIDSLNTIYVADQSNYRIQKWLAGATEGITVAGGNGIAGGIKESNPQYGCRYCNSLKQIQPHSVAVTKDGLMFVSDTRENRILLFPANSNSNTYGTVVIEEDPTSYTAFYGIFTHPNGSIYVCNGAKASIQKISPPNYNLPKTVAGGNGIGAGLNQFNSPHNLYVDDNENIYVADELNNRIMYWEKGATTGKVVAGGNGKGNALNQFEQPRSVIVDKCNNMYIVDYKNKRIIKWAFGATEGKVISGAALNNPHSMLFKQNGDIYIADDENNLIQKWTR